MWRQAGRWVGLLAAPPAEVIGTSRAECLELLDRAAGEAVLTVEVMPELAGVAEAAEIMGWDKRRVITYINRGSFPAPFATLASGRVWRRDDVEAYATAWRRRHDAAGARSRGRR
jgi:hypothetical protein